MIWTNGFRTNGNIRCECWLERVGIWSFWNKHRLEQRVAVSFTNDQSWELTLEFDRNHKYCCRLCVCDPSTFVAKRTRVFALSVSYFAFSFLFVLYLPFYSRVCIATESGKSANMLSTVILSECICLLSFGVPTRQIIAHPSKCSPLFL